MNKYVILLLSVILTLLSGCTAFDQKHQKVIGNINQAKSDFEQFAKAQKRLHYVDVVNDFYVPQLSVDDALKPQWWFKKITQLNSNQLPLADLMVILENEYAVTSQFAADVAKDITVDLNHSGTMGSLIERIARQTNLHFEFAKDTLVWQQYQSKLFHVSFIASDKEIPGHQNIADTLNKEELKTASADQPVPIKTTDSSDKNKWQKTSGDVWQDISDTLSQMISATGRFSLSQSSSTIMAYDHPQHIGRIEQYINALNHKLTQQIAIEVQIIEVKMNDSFEYGINWNIVREVMSQRATVNLVSQIQNSLFTDSSPNSMLIDVTSPNTPYSGSSALIQALEQQGQVSITTSPSTVTLNNQQAQINISEQTSYLASSSTNQSPNVGTQTSLKPGVVTTGLSLSVLPLVVGGEIILNIEGQLSSLTEIEIVESGGSVIQTPSVSGKHILQNVRVPVNKTLMLAGFKTSLNSSSDSGTFGQAWLNGNTQTKELVSEVIILLKPTLIY